MTLSASLSAPPCSHAASRAVATSTTAATPPSAATAAWLAARLARVMTVNCHSLPSVSRVDSGSWAPGDSLPRRQGMSSSCGW